MFNKKAVLKNFAIFTGKQLWWSLFLIKLQAFRPVSLLKWDSITGVFLCILRIFIYFEKHLRTAASDSFSNLFVFGCLFTIIEKNHDILWCRKCHFKWNCNQTFHHFDMFFSISEPYILFKTVCYWKIDCLQLGQS